MKLYILPEVDAARADGIVQRALRGLRDALNDLSGRSTSGTATLQAGVAKVVVPALQTGTLVVVGYVTEAGTPGRLRCSPAEHDVANKVAVIRSSSTTDASTVAWVAVT